MFYQYNTIRITCACLLSCVLYSGNSTATASNKSNETIEAVFGRSEQLNIKLDHWIPGSQIIIGGGGPFLDGEYILDANIIALTQLDDISFLATDDGRIVSIRWGDSPAAGNNNGATPGSARILHSLAVNSPIRQLKAAGHLLLAATDDHDIIAYKLNNGVIEQAGKHSFNAAISDFSIDDRRIVVLTAQQNIHSLRFQFNDNHAVSFVDEKQKRLKQTARSIAHQEDFVFIAGPAMGLSLYSLADPSTIKRLDNVNSAGQALNMLYKDGILYVADGDKGAAMYRITKNRRIRWLGSHSKLGAVSQIWSYADKIFIRNERLRIAELNFDDPSLPITGDIYKPDTPIDVAAQAQGYVYTAYRKRLQRIDFHHRGATQISNEGINLGGSRRAYVENHIAYVADWFSGLHIYDMRLPQQPRHLGNYHTPGSSKGVVVKDRIAYVADDDHGLQIIDVRDPTAPKLISHINSTGLAYTLKYHRKKIYLADHRGGFHIIDVANPKKPRELTHYDTPGKAWAIAAKKNHVFVADDQSGLLVFDIRNAAKPVEIGQYKPGGYAEDLEIHGNIAYVSFFDQGLHIVDISNPRKPRLIASLAIPGNARSIRVRNNLAYIAGWESGLQVVDVSDSKHPRLLASLDTSGSTWGVDIEGDYAYLWDWWGGVKVADISNPKRPHLIGEYQNSENINALAIENNYAFVAQGGNGLQVFDVTNPANPIWMTGMNLPGVASSLTTSSEHVFVAMESAGFAVIDNKNPFQLRLLTRVAVDGSIHNMLYHDNRLYLARDKREILVFDVRQPNTPHLSQQMDGEVNNWAITDNKLVYSSDHGLHVLPANQPIAGSASYMAGMKFDCLALAKDIVAACDGSGNIHLLRLASDRFELQTVLKQHHRVASLLLHDQDLYLNSYSEGVWQFDISDAKKPRLTARYRATGRDKKMAWYKNTLIFSGNRILDSLPLLPALKSTSTNKGELQLDIPAGLGMGYYHLWIRDPNDRLWFYPNRLHVGLKRARKPAITMEKFKELMKQQLQKSKASQTPKK